MDRLSRGGKIREKVARALRPFADRGVLRGWVADFVEEARTDEHSRLPASLQAQLTHVERVRAEAALARIGACVGDRTRLLGLCLPDLLRLQEELVAGEPTIRFPFAPRDASETVSFALSRAELDRFGEEAATDWQRFRETIADFCGAEGLVQRETVALVVRIVAEVGAAVRQRRHLSGEEKETLAQALRMVSGAEPAALTNGEATVALSRALFAGLRCRGDEAVLQGEGGIGRDA